MAPEVMCHQNHGVAVDYFALGVMTYECMFGRRPYNGRSRKEIREAILAKQVNIKKWEVPDGWSSSAAEFINQLIQRKPMNRLGVNGPAQVKAHPWLENFPWQKLEKKQFKAPFLPNASDDNFDARQVSQQDNTNEDLISQNAMLLRNNQIQELFAEYTYENCN